MTDPTAAPSGSGFNGAGDVSSAGGAGTVVTADDAPTTQLPVPEMTETPSVAAAGETAAPEPIPDSVTCPECGTTAVITVNRRESTDFCRQCDFPLFWTPSAIIRDTGRAGADSLRRLPGTAGRVTVASVPCPHCAEPNLLGAQVCVRCGLPMRLAAPKLLPEPVYVAPPPEPEPEEEPEKHVPWWVWAMIAILLAATIALVVMGATGVIG